MYAEKLRAAGVDVAVGAVHPKAKQAVAAAAERLRGALSPMKE